MININIKATGIELTPALRAYVEEKIQAVEKFIAETAVAQADVEIGQTTQHHQSGNIFRCEINLTLNGNLLRVERTQEDLYAAIDVAKDELLDQVRSHKDKKTKIERRGARTFKRFLHRFGFGDGNES